VVAGTAPSADARRGALAAAALLALLVGAVFWPVVFGDRTLSPAPWVPGVLPSGPYGAPPPPPATMRDLEGGAWVDEPAPYLVHRPLAAVTAPLWNPGAGLGAPLAANPNMATWSPLQLPTNLWPTPLVQDLTWVLRVYLLAVATWALARALGFTFWPAVASAGALALSGQTIEWVVHHPLNTDVFVPAALAAALGVLRGRRGAPIVLALAVGAALLGVKPQSAITGALFGLAVLAAMLRDDASLRSVRLADRIGRVVVAAALGAVLAAVALVPFLESYDEASGLVRAGRGSQAEWTLPLRALPGLVGPWLPSLTGSDVAPLAGPPYAGAAVVLLAFAGFWRTRRRALGWVLGATVVLYLTRIFGLLPIPLADVPVLGSISFVKYCFPLYLALALLAGLALDGAPRGGPHARRGFASGAGVALGLLAIVSELAWLGLRPRPLRTDPYAPAPYVSALAGLVAEAPGRISGPVDLLPPLVSAVLGFRDLRAIDVLTPRDGYDFVSQVVAPSQGLTWILADPDPLVAATAPGAGVADLRWILSRDALAAERLPAAVRSLAPGRRLQRLFAHMESHRIESSRTIGGGIAERDGDRRFHWICTTPCRFTLAFPATPRWFAAGIATPERAELTVTTTLRAGALERSDVARVTLDASSAWRDVWIEGAETRAAPTVVTVTIDAPQPASVFVGGIGPSPGVELERAEAVRELAYRSDALARLRVRHRDDTALVIENPGALGEAYLATAVAPARDMDGVRACLLAHPGQAVACVADPTRVPAAPADVAPGTARVLRSGDARLEVEVEAARDALLVVSRLDAPGWRATVDATEVEITRVHGAMMGVVVPQGAHRVALAYRPRSVLLGALLSLAGLVALVVWARRV